MSGFRLLPEAEKDLDEIWLYIARASSSIEVANQFIDAITDRFWVLARNPKMGRSRDGDLRPGLRSFPVGDYVIVYRIEEPEVIILRVMHGNRDLESVFPE